MNAVDWSLYDSCYRCTAAAGEPCRALRQWMGRVRVTDAPTAKPHAARARVGGAS